VNSQNGNIPVVDVDQTFPLLTTEGLSRGSGDSPAPSDQGPAVAAVLRDVLGWRPRVEESKAFISALTASFKLREFEGHVETTYVPRGFAMQADLGLVSGGQASLYARARSAADQATELLDSLVPLRQDSDPEDCEAFRVLVRQEISGLVNELGTPGGPRHVVVDSSFTILAGQFVSTESVTADDVPGQLGALRDRFGLIDANVNSVEEERIRTSFWTLVDLITGLRRSWEDQKPALASGSGSGFLGTDLVVISRLMHAAAEQLDEFEAVLTSAMVTASERQTISLKNSKNKGMDGLTLDGLIQWMRSFLTRDGIAYIRDAGRDGIRTAFAPMIQTMVETFRIGLPGILPATDEALNGQLKAGEPWPVRYLPTHCGQDSLPPGMYAARTRIAATGLCRVLNELFTTSAQLGRYPGILLLDAQFDGLPPNQEGFPYYVRMSLRGSNFRPTYIPALLELDPNKKPTVLHLPLKDSASADVDTLVGIFRFDDGDDLTLWNLLENDAGVVVPAHFVPIAVVDRETGQLISSPPTLVWPELTPANAKAAAHPPTWSDLDAVEDMPFWTDELQGETKWSWNGTVKGAEKISRRNGK
jgi:hypothetical protein